MAARGFHRLSSDFGQFVWAPREVLRACRGNPTVLQLYVVLTQYLSRSTDDYIAFPSLGTIAEEMGLSERSATRTIQLAVQLRVIEVRAEREKGRFGGNVYVLTTPSRWKNETNLSSHQTPLLADGEPPPHATPHAKPDAKSDALYKEDLDQIQIEPDPLRGTSQNGSSVPSPQSAQDKTPNDSYRAQELYSLLYKAHYGLDPTIEKKDWGIFKRLVTAAGFDSYAGALRAYFATRDPQIVKRRHPLGWFATELNRWRVEANGNGQRHTQPSLPGRTGTPESWAKYDEVIIRAYPEGEPLHEFEE